MWPLAIAPGTVVLERYRVERRLGEGGMGEVWAAIELATGAEIALKVMKHEVADALSRRRFVREARAASAARHPHVVRIFDILDEDGQPPVIAMELLVGASLRERLDRTPRLPLAEAAALLVPVISAVGAAHALGIVHRDLKPENIFLARGPGGAPEVKVLDFGLAKLTAREGAAMRSSGLSTGAVIGTPAYMAPEQVFAERDLDHRADIWALGVILYECLAGIRPTAADTVGQILKRVVHEQFTPLAEHAPEVPAPVTSLVAQMLARAPADRPASLHEVAAVLGAYTSVTAPPFGPPRARAAPSEPPAVSDRPGAEGEAATERLGHGREPHLPAGADQAQTEPIAPGARAPTAPALQARSPAAPPGTSQARRRGRGEPGAAPRERGARARWRRPGALAAAVALAAAIAAGAWWAQRPGASPLAAREARLACPPLRAAGVEAPAGWLGAAAAAIACERARALLGGRTERVLAPAELLDLPRGPSERAPADPFAEPEARARAVIAARARAHAYLDGEVTGSSAGFEVRLELRAADGRLLRRGAGAARGLYAAVRAALAPLVAPGAIPPRVALDPGPAAWAGSPHIDDALAAIDLAFALAHNAGELPAECARFRARSAQLGAHGAEGEALCAFTLGASPPARAAAPPGAPGSDAERATQIRVALLVHQRPDPGALAAIEAVIAREPTARGRSIAAAIASCLLSADGDGSARRARERAVLAVQSDPTNPEGGWCNPWEQLLAQERGTPTASATQRAMAAWQPWSSYAWLEPGLPVGATDPAALPLLRRAYRLSPLDAQIAEVYSTALVASGDPAAARGVAASLRAGGLQLHEVGAEVIAARADAAERQLGAAYARARRAAVVRPGDRGWVRAQRFEAAWLALELAAVLGTERETADWAVEHFLAADPPVLEHPATPIRAPALCVWSSQPGPCLARLRALRAAMVNVDTPDAATLAAGAERYAAGDLAGAADHWRGLLAGRAVLVAALPEAMATAFARTGSPDLADRVDEIAMRAAPQLGGATLGHVRAATRAAARGEGERARRLAAEVEAAWALADRAVPAVAQVRALVTGRAGAGAAAR
jgi:hypothetical protein